MTYVSDQAKYGGVPLSKHQTQVWVHPNAAVSSACQTTYYMPVYVMIIITFRTFTTTIHDQPLSMTTQSCSLCLKTSSDSIINMSYVLWRTAGPKRIVMLGQCFSTFFQFFVPLDLSPPFYVPPNFDSFEACLKKIRAVWGGMGSILYLLFFFLFI